MVLPRQVRQNIEKQDFEAVESHWLESSEASLEDLSYFSSVARALVGAGQRETAAMLLELLDDQLRGQGEWEQRLDLLRRVGKIQLAPAKLHAAILETLREIYSETAALDRLIETVGLDRGANDTDKTWSKVSRLESLIRFDEGVVVYMTDKGVGRVVEVNHKLESFKVEIEGKGAVRVGFRAAAKMLDALPDDHPLARKLNDPESLDALKPSELLGEILRSFDRPLTASEVRDALHGVVTTSRWSSWWTSARKHPQVVASTEVRNAYCWVEDGDNASGTIWRSFEKATPRGQIDLLRRASSHDDQLRERMATALERRGRDALRSAPALAFEIWHALERAGAEPKQRDWEPRIVVESLTDTSRLLGSLESRALRERAIELVGEVREDWVDAYEGALKTESDAKIIASIAERLQEEAPKVYRRAVSRCVAQPQRAPGFFVWLTELAAEDEAVLAELGTRLFRKVLAALSLDEMSPFKTRLVKMCESGGTLPKALPLLSEDQAREAEMALERAAGLTRDLREPLLNAIHLKFPDLRSESVEPLYALPESIQAKRHALKELLEVEIPANRNAIEEARALGDLRENFEYKAARQRHEYLTSLAEGLNRDLERSRSLDLGAVDASQVRVGTAIKLVRDDDEQSITILGPWESSPEEGIVSYESDLGRKLLGRSEGDTVELNDETLTISAIAAVEA